MDGGDSWGPGLRGGAGARARALFLGRHPAACCLLHSALGNLKSAMWLWEKTEDFFP